MFPLFHRKRDRLKLKLKHYSLIKLEKLQFLLIKSIKLVTTKLDSSREREKKCVAATAAQQTAFPGVHLS